MMKRITTCVLFLAGAVALFYFACNWRARSNTDYVAQWSEAAFASVRMGDSMDKVWQKLGTPLDIVIYQPGVIPTRPPRPWNLTDIQNLANGSTTVAVLQYSRPRNDRIETYRSVGIDFRSSMVTGKTDGI